LLTATVIEHDAKLPVEDRAVVAAADETAAVGQSGVLLHLLWRTRASDGCLDARLHLGLHALDVTLDYIVHLALELCVEELDVLFQLEDVPVARHTIVWLRAPLPLAVEEDRIRIIIARVLGDRLPHLEALWPGLRVITAESSLHWRATLLDPTP